MLRLPSSSFDIDVGLVLVEVEYTHILSGSPSHEAGTLGLPPIKGGPFSRSMPTMSKFPSSSVGTPWLPAIKEGLFLGLL